MSSEILVRSKAGGQEPDQHAWASGISYVSKYIGWFLGPLILVSLVLGFAAYRAGSFSRALPYLMGQRFFVAESKIHLGELVCGAEAESSIRLINLGSKPISIIGARKSCGCIALESVPFEVSAGSTRPLKLKVKIPDGVGKFAHTIELYVADQGFSSFHVVLFGKTARE